MNPNRRALLAFPSTPPPAPARADAPRPPLRSLPFPPPVLRVVRPPAATPFRIPPVPRLPPGHAVFPAPAPARPAGGAPTARPPIVPPPSAVGGPAAALADDDRAETEVEDAWDDESPTVEIDRFSWSEVEVAAATDVVVAALPITRVPVGRLRDAPSPARDVPAPVSDVPAPVSDVPAPVSDAPVAAVEPPAPSTPSVVLPPPTSRWRTMWSQPALMHFNRLLVLTLLVNAAILVGGLVSGAWDVSPAATFATIDRLVVGNLALAILIRQHYVVNLLFWLATRAPVSWPLGVRATLAKVYHFGGLHVGGAIAATAWFVALVVQILLHRAALGLSAATVAVAVVQMIVLLAICYVSRPSWRARHHDRFELVKRLGGWSSLVLFWVQTVLVTADRTAGPIAAALVASPEVWILALVTFSVALPWMRLRKVPVELVVPSSHVALARFDYGVTPFAGSSTAISRSPLTEWHSFANVPSPGQTGFRLTISRAGDWTGALIDDRPSHVWVKGIPTAGVANIETLFKRVVYIATGSGIGPCLPHLLANKVPAKLVWATRDARKTYGDALVDEILAVHPDAVIWDTHKLGKPDMVQLAYQAWQETGAEAVICISNKKLTWQVVSGMESRGVPAYGAIWDS